MVSDESKQDLSGIRLIVQGDDLGAGHGVNTGTIRAHREGVLTSANVIVPGPWFSEAVSLAAEYPRLDVGVHLVLTSEWDAVRWRPLTPATSVVDVDGFFPTSTTPREGGTPGASLAERPWRLGDVEAELRAQIEQARRRIPRVSYLWPHMLFTQVDRAVEELVGSLADEYGLVQPRDAELTILEGVWTREDPGPTRARNLAAQLDALAPGTWMHFEHGADDTEEIQGFGHPGYEDVARDRAANVEAWTSPEVRQVVRDRGIQLIGYADLP